MEFGEYAPPVRRRVTHPVVGKSKTQQQFKDDADVNAIMKRWRSTGSVEHVMATQPTFGDFTDAVDFHRGVNRVLEAQEQFEQLPSEVRRAVDNDPGKLLELVADPERRDLVEELGLGALAEHLHGPKPEPAEPAPEPGQGPAPAASPQGSEAGTPVPAGGAETHTPSS